MQEGVQFFSQGGIDPLAVRKDDYLVVVQIGLPIDHIIQIFPFQEHPHCARIGIGIDFLLGLVHETGVGLAGEEGDVGYRLHIVQPFLLFLQLLIGGPNQLVGGHVHLALGMHLVADGAFRPVGGSQAHLVAQGVGMLEAAELAPGAVELAGHAQVVHAQLLYVPGGKREVVVAPAAGGKALQLQMGVHESQIPAAPLDMSAIVEYGEPRLYPVDGLPYFFCIIGIDSLAQFQD